MTMIKILPINDCSECPKLLDEKELKGCELSDIRCYDVEDDWMSYLEQFCPLQYLEDIVDEAYAKGEEFARFKKKTGKEVKESVEPSKWAVAHQFLEKVSDKPKGERG